MLGDISMEEMQASILDIMLAKDGHMLVQDIQRAQSVYWFYKDVREALEDLRAKGIVVRFNVNAKKMKAYRLAPEARRKLLKEKVQLKKAGDKK